MSNDKDYRDLLIGLCDHALDADGLELIMNRTMSYKADDAWFADPEVAQAVVNAWFNVDPKNLKASSMTDITVLAFVMLDPAMKKSMQILQGCILAAKYERLYKQTLEELVALRAEVAEEVVF